MGYHGEAAIFRRALSTQMEAETCPINLGDLPCARQLNREEMVAGRGSGRGQPEPDLPLLDI